MVLENFRFSAHILPENNEHTNNSDSNPLSAYIIHRNPMMLSVPMYSLLKSIILNINNSTYLYDFSKFLYDIY